METIKHDSPLCSGVGSCPLTTVMDNHWHLLLTVFNSMKPFRIGIKEHLIHLTAFLSDL